MVRETKRNVKRIKKRSYKYKRRSYKKRTNRKRTNRKRTNRKRSKSKIGGTLEGPFNQLSQLRKSEEELREFKKKLSGYDDEGLGVQICEGVHLYGLQYCLKEKYRLHGKIDKKLLEIDKIDDKKQFLLKAFAQDPVKDVLRFTIILNLTSSEWRGL